MFKKFAAALIATTLIAAPAFAQTSGGSSGTAPAAAAVQTKAAPAAPTAPVKMTRTAKHTAKHVRKHVARSKAGSMHFVRHTKTVKTHQASAGKAAKHS